MSAKASPRCVEISVSSAADGKISIEKFEWSSGWHTSFGRKFEIPEGWTDSEIEEFQLEQYAAIQDIVDAIDTEECEKRRKASSVDSIRLGEDE